MISLSWFIIQSSWNVKIKESRYLKKNDDTRDSWSTSLRLPSLQMYGYEVLLTTPKHWNVDVDNYENVGIYWHEWDK